ncbi:MAG: trehalose-phosphatase [candidate division Zixibacteria bacterium]|nr:trehalose-phosphatase [candidate division Zixibacteria bacterium]
MLKLFEEYQQIEKKIFGKKFLFIGLDYDGTLTPIVSHPHHARLPHDTKSLLTNLCALPHTLLCIISGRSWEDVRRKVGIKRIIFAGNHGMEIKGGGFSFSIKDSQKYVEEINKICRKLTQRLKEIEGVWVENKGLTASVHYRLADSEDIQKVKQIIFPIINTSKDLKLNRGKKVWEIRPNIDWNKGKAVAYILERCLGKDWKSKGAVVYIGDDKTDEDAFSLLKQNGVTALVSRKPPRISNAQYSLAHPKEVISFLRWLGNLWEDKGVKP